MPKLPWKRGDATSEPPPLSSYLPTQPVDYTALPIVEDESPGARFRRLSPIARIGVVVLPLLVVGLVVWGVRILTAPTPVPPPPPPVITLGDARAVSPAEITIDGTTVNVRDGTPVTATLLADGTAVDWADPTTSVGTVSGNRFSMSLRRADSWNQSLNMNGTYSVDVQFGTQPPVASSAPLIVPSLISEEFYAAGFVPPVPTEVPTLAPTLEPTAEPTAPPPTEAPTLEPTPEPTVPPPTPTVAGPPSIAAAAGATLLISPTLGSGILARPDAGATFEPLLRTPDSQYFLVLNNGQAGWLPAGQATIDPAAVERVPMTTPSPEAVQAGPLRATAINGGNIRFLPNVQTGTVLGQMRANDAVTLKARLATSTWYRIVAPAAEGWVSASLLRIPASVAAQVPVAAPGDFAPPSGGVSGSSATVPVVQAAPLPTPTPPAVSSSLAAAAVPGAMLLIAPQAGSDVVSRPEAGTPLRPLLRTADSSLVLVLEGKRTGWIAQEGIGLTKDQIAQVPPVNPSREAVEAGPVHATVGEDGNVRIGPLPTATILGVAHRGEVLTLKARTKDGMWYRVVAPAAEGWLNAPSLIIAPGSDTTVPVAE